MHSIFSGDVIIYRLYKDCLSSAKPNLQSEINWMKLEDFPSLSLKVLCSEVSQLTAVIRNNEIILTSKNNLGECKITFIPRCLLK